MVLSFQFHLHFRFITSLSRCMCACVCEYVFYVFIAECVQSLITSSQYAITLPFLSSFHLGVCACFSFLFCHLTRFSFIFPLLHFLFIACQRSSADGLHMCCVVLKQAHVRTQTFTLLRELKCSEK